MQRVVVEEEGEALDEAVDDVRVETGPPNGIIFALSDLLQEREASEIDVKADDDEEKAAFMEEKEKPSQPERKDACSLEHLSQGVSFSRLRRSCRLELYSCGSLFQSSGRSSQPPNLALQPAFL